ncbi:unnamed protein product [Owenia fusiformis]|uniref:Metalloendopeptidase n=1 Tax=Owenia fusiformis TaxID=6347 RepID=A0A8J1TGV3_OWEFU|nr:unnamed protein product [Owenia fusiformis]
MFALALVLVSLCSANALELESIDNIIDNELTLTDDGDEIIELDIVVPKDARPKRNTVPERKWPLGEIPYEFDPAFQGDRALVERAMQTWNQVTCVRFRPATASDVAKLKVVTPSNEGDCSTAVGTYGGTQNLNLGARCQQMHVVLHELGHTVGLQHEHQHPDRDMCVTVNLQNIQETGQQWYRKFTRQEVDTQNVEYNPLSIMHYGNTFFWNGNGATMKANDPTIHYQMGKVKELAATDIKKVNILYQCPGHQKPAMNPIPSCSVPKTTWKQPDRSCKDSAEEKQCRIWYELGNCVDPEQSGITKKICASHCSACGGSAVGPGPVTSGPWTPGPPTQGPGGSSEECNKCRQYEQMNLCTNPQFKSTMDICGQHCGSCGGGPGTGGSGTGGSGGTGGTGGTSEECNKCKQYEQMNLCSNPTFKTTMDICGQQCGSCGGGSGTGGGRPGTGGPGTGGSGGTGGTGGTTEECNKCKQYEQMNLCSNPTFKTTMDICGQQCGSCGGGSGTGGGRPGTGGPGTGGSGGTGGTGGTTEECNKCKQYEQMNLCSNPTFKTTMEICGQQCGSCGGATGGSGIGGGRPGSGGSGNGGTSEECTKCKQYEDMNLCSNPTFQTTMQICNQQCGSCGRGGSGGIGTGGSGTGGGWPGSGGSGTSGTSEECKKCKQYEDMNLCSNPTFQTTMQICSQQCGSCGRGGSGSIGTGGSGTGGGWPGNGSGAGGGWPGSGSGTGGGWPGSGSGTGGGFPGSGTGGGWPGSGSGTGGGWPGSGSGTGGGFPGSGSGTGGGWPGSGSGTGGGWPGSGGNWQGKRK